jgi:hypothetical protein
MFVTPDGTVKFAVVCVTYDLINSITGPVAGAALVHAVPLLVSKLPVVPGATEVTADVPLPIRTLLAVSVVAPVPPFATPRVPDKSPTGTLAAAVNADVPLPLT